MVRERHPGQDLVGRYGPPKAQYPDEVFTKSQDLADDNYPQLLVQEVGELVFHDIDDGESVEVSPNGKDPFARDGLIDMPESRNRNAGSSDKVIKPHLGETFVIIDCEGQPRTLKYHAKRNDPNGYVETQYTMFFLDQHWRVCGFQVRSHFSAR